MISISAVMLLLGLELIKHAHSHGQSQSLGGQVSRKHPVTQLNAV